MTNLTNRLLAVFLLFGLTHGANVSSSDGPKECGFFKTYFQKFDCIPEIFAYARDMSAVTLDVNKIKDFRKSCNARIQCHAKQNCLRNDDEFIGIRTKVNESCASLDYLATDHRECQKKLVQLNSKCKRENSCESMFGKNYCYRQLILENCGVGEWKGFQKSILNLMKHINKECNYDELWSL